MTIRTRPGLGTFILVVLTVSAAGAVVAWLCGNLAAYLYLPGGSRDEGLEIALLNVGRWWGAATGFMAGIIWCGAVWAIASRRGTAKLGRIGALMGMAVGSFSTLLLHIGLARVSGDGGVGLVREGLLFGIPAGLIVGGICGRAYRSIIMRPVSNDGSTTAGVAEVEQPESP